MPMVEQAEEGMIEDELTKPQLVEVKPIVADALPARPPIEKLLDEKKKPVVIETCLGVEALKAAKALKEESLEAEFVVANPASKPRKHVGGGDGAGDAAGDGGADVKPVSSGIFNSGDRYAGMTLVEKLGAGASGETWKAKWNGTSGVEIAYALKIPLPGSEKCLRDLEREVAAASAIDHSAVLRIVRHDLSDRQPFIAYEFIEGESLRQKLKGKTYSVEDALSVICQVLDGVDAAHAVRIGDEKGILHRDIKPENILVTEKGVKVIDFGLAKFVRDLSGSIEHTLSFSQTGSVAGTLSYMAPEAENGEAQVESDIYSIAAVLYETITGENPKKLSINALDVLEEKLKNTPRDKELIKIIKKGLHKNPAQRYHSAQEFKQVLQEAGALPVEVEKELTEEEQDRQEIVDGSRKKLDELVVFAKGQAQKYSVNPARVTTNGVIKHFGFDLFDDYKQVDELTVHDVLMQVYGGKTQWVRAKEYTKNAVKNVWNKADPIIDGVVDKAGKAGIAAGKYLWGTSGGVMRRVVRGAYDRLSKNVNRTDMLVKAPAVVYNDFLVEENAKRDVGQVDKSLMYYDKSLADLRSKGFARHLRPQEVFGLLADGLEGKLSGEQKVVYDDMLSSYGEWLSLVFERDGNNLVCYLDPEGLVWKDGRYVKDANFKFVEKKVFDIAGKSSDRWIDLREFGDDFVRFLYGRSFSDLPVQMWEGALRAQVYLPPDKTAWPVGRGYGIRFDVYGFGYDIGASRGSVPVVQKKFELFSSLYHCMKDTAYNQLIKDMMQRSETLRGLRWCREKLKSLLTPAEKVALLENEDYKVIDGKVIESVPSVLYKDFFVEAKAKRDVGQVDKSLMYYDKSLADLRSKGFARHLRSQEVFGLLADGLEGKLSGEQKVVYDDMLVSYGEWLSLAFERDGNKLFCYVDPEGLVWKDNRYVKDNNFKFSEKKEFDISGKSSRVWIDLREFGDDFVKFLYGRFFSHLPVQMQEGGQRAQVYLPPDKTAWPVGRGNCYWFGVFGFNYYGRASRGSVPRRA